MGKLSLGVQEGKAVLDLWVSGSHVAQHFRKKRASLYGCRLVFDTVQSPLAILQWFGIFRSGDRGVHFTASPPVDDLAAGVLYQQLYRTDKHPLVALYPKTASNASLLFLAGYDDYEKRVALAAVAIAELSLTDGTADRLWDFLLSACGLPKQEAIDLSDLAPALQVISHKRSSFSATSLAYSTGGTQNWVRSNMGSSMSSTHHTVDFLEVNAVLVHCYAAMTQLALITGNTSSLREWFFTLRIENLVDLSSPFKTAAAKDLKDK
eukprot:2321684-Amphidinium_carterae.1